MVDKESKLVYSIMVRFPKDRAEDDPRGFGSAVITSEHDKLVSGKTTE